MVHASRRGFLAAFAAFTGTGTGTAVALAPSRGETLPDPDAELIEAGERLTRAIAFRDEAMQRAEAAARAEQADLGPCPPELFLSHDDGGWRIDPRLVDQRLFGRKGECRFRWEAVSSGEEETRSQVWTAPDIRHAIATAPAVLGRAGLTPFIIRDLRGLLPIAEARDAAWSRAECRHGASELWKAYREARAAVDAEVKRITDMPAVGLSGIAVKARTAEWWMEERAELAWRIPLPAPVQAVLDAVAAVGRA